MYTMTYNKDIFDAKDLPVSIKRKLQIETLKEDPFRDKIFKLFSMAKSQNIHNLTDNQITVGYFRAYTSKNSQDFKTLSQIRAKLRSIIQYDKNYNLNHPESKIQTLKRVGNEKETYTID